MEYIYLSSHAEKRMQQRAINKLQIELIQSFGDFLDQKGGTKLAYLDRDTINKLRKAINQIENVHVVLGEEDKVITVMHQTKKLKKTH